MATGIIRIVAASAVVALALAAPALAKQDASVGFDVSAANASAGYDTAALKALGARYQAMADYYLGHTTGDSSDVVSRYIDRNAPVVTRDAPDGFQPQLQGPEAAPVAGTDDGFDWRIFGIATGSALLAAALGGTALIATRTRGRVAHP